MSIARKILMGAAGAGGDSTYIDDVFSTYLWRGDGNSGRLISNGLKLSNANSGNSVNFNGVADNKINIAASADFAMGSGDFTWEAWVYHNSSSNIYRRIICTGTSWGASDSCGLMWDHASHNNQYNFYSYNLDTSGPFLNSATHATFDGDGLWHHVAVTRSGNTFTMWVDGVNEGTATKSGSFEGVATPTGSIGACFDTTNVNECWAGNINDVRITKGQALYTTNFTPSTQELTTTSQGATGSNVKLLCCNGTTASSATVTPNSLTVLNKVKAESFGRFTGTDGKGGLVWMKSRTTGNVNVLFDTERGANQRLRSDSNLGQNNVDLLQPSFTNSGFTVGSGNEVNGSGNDYTSWTFRKTKGFFDVVTWTGNDTNRQISHDLGSVPGCIIVKRTDASGDWRVYHRSLGAENVVFLNTTDASGASSTSWNDLAPTSSVFNIGTNGDVNAGSGSFVAYLFAGGESTAATARSVHFSSNYMNTTTSSSDFTMGTGDFTIECWVNRDDQGQCGVFQISDTSGGLKTSNYGNTLALASVGNIAPGRWQIYGAGSYAESTPGHAQKQWVHMAYVRHNGVSKLYQDGIELISQSDTTNYDGTYIAIGAYYDTSMNYKGYISNFRVVKGTAVYTSSFTPPTEPLKNISGTVLLCLNDSSVTGATVTPQTLNSQGGPTASTNSPFDDPEGFKFGEGGDQNIIKCGQLKTDSGNGAILNLPWEPQWIIYKHVNANSNWHMLDCMRGWTSDGTVQILSPNLNNAESGGGGYEELKSRTIKFQGYGNNYDFIYMAIRRPDGLVGKPAEAGTDVFTVVNGDTDGDATTPWMLTPHIVDFALFKGRNITHNWGTSPRVTQGYYLSVNQTRAENANIHQVFDFMDGFNDGTDTSGNYTGWLWKRHAGMDVVTWTGNGISPREFSHNLGKTPEMIWTKGRSSTYDWRVWHKDLSSGGASAAAYNIVLNSTAAQSSNSDVFGGPNNLLPTSTHFTTGGNATINQSGTTQIAYLFASVDGISKVGSYSGTGSSLDITTGFQPRFLILKRTNGSGSWFVLDTVRGWGAGNDNFLLLNSNAPQDGNYNIGAPTSTGFQLNGSDVNYNASGNEYIYYAHA